MASSLLKMYDWCWLAAWLLCVIPEKPSVQRTRNPVPEYATLLFACFQRATSAAELSLALRS